MREPALLLLPDAGSELALVARLPLRAGRCCPVQLAPPSPRLAIEGCRDDRVDAAAEFSRAANLRRMPAIGRIERVEVASRRRHREHHAQPHQAEVFQQPTSRVAGPDRRELAARSSRAAFRPEWNRPAALAAVPDLGASP